MSDVALPTVRRGTRGGGVSRLTIAGAVIIVAWIVAAVFAPALAPYEPTATDVSTLLRPPLSDGHLLG
ncbi:MAG TPA: ABC transporter permease, partial [Actinomycetota bacterium]|nr:ABC transporter permease [Actinomycetota bacterium]